MERRRENAVDLPAEERIDRVLSRCAGSLFGAASEQAAAAQLCRALVEEGGFQRAVVQLFSETAALPPVEAGSAAAGREGDRLVLPLRAREQQVGTLTLMSAEPAALDGAPRAALESLAQVLAGAVALDRARAAAAVAAELKRIADREQRFAMTAIESMPGILYFYDEHGRFLRWSRSFERVSGYSGEEVARMHPLDFFAPEDRALLTERIGEVFVRGESSVEAPFVSKDGTRTPYFFTGRLVSFDGGPCLVGVGVDITDRVRAETALRRLNEGLELRVTERTTELASALERAEAADRIKSAFLATMSHELRTPLNSIIGFTGILQQGLAGPLNDEQTRQLGMVRGSARHLLDLINDVLDITRIEAGQLRLLAAPFDFGASLERTIASVRPLADKKGLSIHASLPEHLPPMRSDQRRVEQIVLNLLNNAIKFTDRGGVTVTVETVTLVEGSEALRVRVEDTGIGIREDELSELFQPFHQLDIGLQRQHEGTGLGLAICRRLCALLGGSIHASSRWSEGSVFTVTLPLRSEVNAGD